jgi:hypothetical protein
MAKENKQKQDVPAAEIAQIIVSKAHHIIRDIDKVVDSYTAAMDVLADKLADQSEVFIQIKEEINKYRP